MEASDSGGSLAMPDDKDVSKPRRNKRRRVVDSDAATANGGNAADDGDVFNAAKIQRETGVDSDETGDSLAVAEDDDQPAPNPTHKKRKVCEDNKAKRRNKVRSKLCPWPGCGQVIKDHMEQHLRTHTGEKPYVCNFPDCNAAFAQSGTLQRHKRTHSGDRPYVCDFPDCRAAFAQHGNLQTHKRLHTGECPYACDFPVCDAAFAQSSALKSHLRTHTGEHPYLCDFPDCDAKFTTSSNLKTHQRTHTGERPYPCDFPYCGASFARSSHLKIHQRTHTGERPYVCDFPDCDAAFTTSSHLKDHKDVLHDPDYVAAVPGASKISCAFLDALENELGIKLQHVHYGKGSVRGSEHQIHRTRYHADGHASASEIDCLIVGLERTEVKIEERGLIVEFLGEPFHGYEENRHADLYNHLGQRFGDLYDKTMNRNDEVVALGYTVIYIWGRSYLAWKKNKDRPLLEYCRWHKPLT